ncbi:Uncharacterised protein [Chlamydia trachomatis]|nr:Uncharacterised protein [Chlamydia trachomatis]
MLTSFFVNNDEVAGQQTVVAVLVRDDLDRRIDFVVALNEATNSGRKTRSEATGGEQSDATNRHGNTFQRWNKCGRTTRTSNTTSLKPQWSWYGGRPSHGRARTRIYSAFSPLLGSVSLDSSSGR